MDMISGHFSIGNTEVFYANLALNNKKGLSQAAIILLCFLFTLALQVG